MSKEIKLIYQDCVRCNGRESWADQQYALAKHYGFAIKRTPHTAVGADGLIRQARLKGVKALAFFTDGKKFSTDLIDFVPKTKNDKTNNKSDAEPAQERKTQQRIRAVKARAKKEPAPDESISES